MAMEYKITQAMKDKYLKELEYLETDKKFGTFWIMQFSSVMKPLKK